MNPSLGKLGVTHDLGWWLVGKPVFDFLFALIELFFAIYHGSGVMRRNLYSSAVFAEATSLHSHFTWTGSSSINHSWHQKTRDNGLPDGEDRIPLRSLVLTQYQSQIDGRTDRRTDIP